MEKKIERRRFLQQGLRAAAASASGACAWSLLAAPLLGREPFQRRSAAPLKLSCAAYSLRKYLDLKKPAMTLEEFILRCAEWGTDGVELTEYYFPKPVTPQYVSRLKKLLAAEGLDLTGTPIGNNFALPPGAERERQIASVKSWIDLSADLGSPAIRIFAGSAPSGASEAEARRWVVECIESLCEHASRRGVFLAIENHGGVVATADGLLEIVKAVQCEWAAVNLDTGNFHTADPYGDMARCAPYAVTCQVKTEVQPAGGKKEEADLQRLIGILKGAKYHGYVTLEYEAAEEPLEAVPRYLKRLRELLAASH